MKIAKKLHPGWFDKFAITRSIPLDLKIHKSFVIEEKNGVLGFITYISSEGETKISWMAVEPKFHRQGIGTKLLRGLEKELKVLGIKELRVDTLDESENYKPYEKTRAFYKKMGFKVEKVKKIKSKDASKEFNLATFSKKL